MEDNDEITTDKAFILMMRRTDLATKIDAMSIKYRNGVMIFIIDCGAEVHAFPYHLAQKFGAYILDAPMRLRGVDGNLIKRYGVTWMYVQFESCILKIKFEDIECQ